jgi:hypothetical protein
VLVSTAQTLDVHLWAPVGLEPTNPRIRGAILPAITGIVRRHK